ncbi:hypothetical protein [Ligilactobacillus murinus]|uniref:Uncharacterized protein n=1 Tax=Ligilactobacillus murinus TaxID=1622 RepID=A0AAE7BR49_9LACO|nr:hypothetical protein [Ligilactobacillus murinus]MBF0758206.1 hypothetical protein [Ligilactobacillus murinus]MBF0831957.1 hypothetical protein [Ligilactobacillus murinus]NEF81936.1 hypothetical protein [Ligilactobacillus murinus]NEF84260.1 hypothetical protein [Ligilactobacillus murinus]NEF86540.1 hypothetical protein [Ligilactobacillus murinus]
MGVTNPSDYTITPHASDRIKQRFGQTIETMRPWVNRLLTQAVFERREETGRERYRYRDIAIIVDIKQKQVITMFPDPQDAIEAERKPINPELQTEVLDMVDKFLMKKRFVLAEALNSKKENIESAINDFHVDHSEDNLTDLREVLNDFRNELEKYDMFVAETKLITRK